MESICIVGTEIGFDENGIEIINAIELKTNPKTIEDISFLLILAENTHKKLQQRRLNKTQGPSYFSEQGKPIFVMSAEVSNFQISWFEESCDKVAKVSLSQNAKWGVASQIVNGDSKAHHF